jgi:hypothetical protein
MRPEDLGRATELTQSVKEYMREYDSLLTTLRSKHVTVNCKVEYYEARKPGTYKKNFQISELSPVFRDFQKMAAEKLDDILESLVKLRELGLDTISLEENLTRIMDEKR